MSPAEELAVRMHKLGDARMRLLAARDSLDKVWAQDEIDRHAERIKELRRLLGIEKSA